MKHHIKKHKWNPNDRIRLPFIHQGYLERPFGCTFCPLPRLWPISARRHRAGAHLRILSWGSSWSFYAIGGQFWEGWKKSTEKTRVLLNTIHVREVDCLIYYVKHDTVGIMEVNISKLFDGGIIKPFLCDFDFCLRFIIILRMCASPTLFYIRVILYKSVWIQYYEYCW